jgi:hypothetical protein
MGCNFFHLVKKLEKNPKIVNVTGDNDESHVGECVCEYSPMYSRKLACEGLDSVFCRFTVAHDNETTRRT